jgi:peptidoglycan/xylan/chitin deacetylase (PgdA/CDA1 family)
MLESGLLNLGAHTHTHADLRDLDRATVADEIEESNELIRSRVGVSPVDFAYPWGYWSESAASVVDHAYATAVLGGSPRAKRPLDPHRVPRFPVQRSDGIEYFSARLEGGLLAEEWVRRRLRGYRGP